MTDQIDILKEAAAKLKTNLKDVPARIEAVTSGNKRITT